MSSLAYLASPYSHPDPAVMQERFEQACKAAAELMRVGVMVFSPIAHSHPIAQYGLPKEWGFWQEYDRIMLAKCDRIIVLMLPGWQTSAGVRNELRFAVDAGLPVEYFKPLKEQPK